MQPFFDKTVNRRLTLASLILFSASIAGGLLGYAYQIITGRLLGESEYGLFSAVMALFGVLSSPMGGLSMMITRRVSEYRAKFQANEIRDFFWAIYFWALLLGCFLCLIGYIAEPFFLKYVKTEKSEIIYFLYGLIFFSIFPSINGAFLQGFQKFHLISIFGPCFFLLKIVFSSLLILVGFGVAGAILGTLSATVIVLGLTFLVVLPLIEQGRTKIFSLKEHISIRYGVPVIMANISFAIMTQLDMVLVNYFFNARDAGIYAAASVLGKAVTYLPHSIVVAFFPSAVENHTLSRSSKNLLIQSIGLTAILSGIAALFYFFFSDLIVRILFGNTYHEAGNLLKYYGFAILPIAISMVLESFLIAKNKVLLSYLFVAMSPLQIAAVYFFHDSLLQIILIMGIFGSLVTCLGFGIILLPGIKIQKIK